ncbi:MAG: DUF1512 domain-containing protein [Desulfurococcaceae archaeon]
MNGTTSTADLVIQIIWIALFLMLITGLNQRIQMKLWAMDVRAKLGVLKRMVDEDRAKVERALTGLGLQNPTALVERVMNFFTIEPVEIEPTDIIKRLDHLIRTTDDTIESYLKGVLPNLDEFRLTLLESSLSIVSALNQIYKVVRHYLLTSERENNWVLLMQLELIMPQVLRIAETYHNALDPFMTGKPIGDSAGPLVAHRLLEEAKLISRRELQDTSIYEALLMDRRVFVIKAKGPGSNVGHPGDVLGKLVDELNGAVDMILTVDAALKLEGEELGEIAEGVGAAIGDPGPEKIAIERAASKYGIPLRALVIKMELRDALNVMRKEVYDACERAVERIKEIIRSETKPFSTIVIAGIGNSLGVPG